MRALKGKLLLLLMTAKGYARVRKRQKSAVTAIIKETAATLRADVGILPPMASSLRERMCVSYYCLLAQRQREVCCFGGVRLLTDRAGNECGARCCITTQPQRYHSRVNAEGEVCRRRRRLSSFSSSSSIEPSSLLLPPPPFALCASNRS